MKDLLDIITDNKVGYKFQCDDAKRIGIDYEHFNPWFPEKNTDKSFPATQKKDIPADAYFTLSHIAKLDILLNLCNQHHLNYNLIIEQWDEKEQEITNEIYIVNNNWKNQ